MKKLIAISVVFALLTGAAFAQVTFSGEVWVGANLIDGNTELKDDAGDAMGPFASQGWYDDDVYRAWLRTTYETDGSEAGVSLKFQFGDGFGDFGFDGNVGMMRLDGAAWWKPMDMLTLWLGDQGFGRGDGLGWNTLVGSSQYGGEDWKQYILYKEGSGNWFGISLAPIDMFTLNLSFIQNNWFDGPQQRIYEEDAIGNTDLAAQYGENVMVQAVIAIPNGFGELAFTFDNAYWNLSHADGDKEVNTGAIFIDYNASNLLDMGIDILFGFSYFMDKDIKNHKGDDEKSFFVGLRAGYSAIENLDVALRFQTWSFNAMGIGLEFDYGMPTGNWTVGVAGAFMYHMGLGDYDKIFPKSMDFEGEMEWQASVLEWEVKPYLTTAIGGFTFSTELKISGNTIEKSGVDYALPIKFAYAW